MKFRSFILTMLFISAWALIWPLSAAEVLAPTEFNQKIRPVLEEYCYDCHGDGEESGGVALDAFNSSTNFVAGRDVWWRVLKNLRAGLMPPAKKSQPSKEQKELVEDWIKSAVFEVNPLNPDPGRITIRRLNRVEYQNTIRDLLGVEFDTKNEFPSDDTGYGFDNIGDVLTISPMLLEKYLVASEKIIGQAVPIVTTVVPEQVVSGRDFHAGAEDSAKSSDPLQLSYYAPASVTNIFSAPQAGQYQLNLDLVISEKNVDDQPDYNKCQFIFRVDGKEMLNQEFIWQDNRRPYRFSYDQKWAAGNHQLDFELQPLLPGSTRNRTLAIQINSVTVRGPIDDKNGVQPKNYARFFPKPVPKSTAGRRNYSRELLGNFASRAFRRPVDKETTDRLVKLAENVYDQPGKTFEAGVAQAMVAVLASPRFVFREEGVEPISSGQAYALVDEYALASRLSYFLWSSMPDEELFQQAAAGTLRKNLPAQVTRMLADKHSDALEKNFVGQWLQARDVEAVAIDARSVLAREQKVDVQKEAQQKRFQELRNKTEETLTPAEKDELASLRTSFGKARKVQPRADFPSEIRHAMRQETEDVFGYVLHEDRSLLELLDSDYTFLNERLARYYGITNVVGQEMRLVTLPPDSPRGGILTEGTVLAVTSNPTRTSPVKRGVFILDNILGTPPLPPPPNIPALEDALQGMTNHTPTLRETLAVHRENALCASCHNQMDPLGLALENFNAMGMWRDQEFTQPIDASGQLITGEKFSNVKELKQTLVKNHAEDFYRTLTQKMLTYALGRGLDYYDVETVDQIVARIEKSDGKPSALMAGIIESAPFQKTRNLAPATIGKDLKPATKQIMDVSRENTKEKL
jgi:Protein of unknown function (DUF1592)/Protein of unknown function (DUF1588)/Protein of unknown function (DUF1587)/Protein of unknown function (DUF1585)/Protein of unknown function (DUF1595)/Planctomycete cytochrome C